MVCEKITNFLRPIKKIGNGNGYGNGYSDGYGDGYGNGYSDGYSDGYGDGNGDGYGNGNGDGYGDGYGDGINFIDGKKIFIIDKLQTIILSVKNDVAKGFVLENDLSLTPCFIVRNEYHFSHGNSLKEALESLEEKTTLTLPIEFRIKNFNNQFKDYSKKYKAQLLYEWHYKLTGSCKMGRDSFCANNNIDLSKTKLTIYEFIELTKNQYGGEIIKQLIK